MGYPAMLYPGYLEGQELVQGCEFVHEDFCGSMGTNETTDLATFDLVGTSAVLTVENDSLGGVIKLLTDTTNPAFLIQNGEPVKLAANRKIWLEFKGVKLADADGMSFFAGLAITNANVFSGSVTDWVGFYTTDGNIKCGTGKNSTSVPGSGTSGTLTTFADTGSDFADNTAVRLLIVINGVTDVRFYVDGVLKQIITTTLPDDEYLAVHFGQVGSAETTYLDRVYGYMSNVDA